VISAASAAGMALVAFGMVLTPGPNMIYLVSRSLSQGRRAGLISLLGTIAGFVIYMSMANLGLAAAFVSADWQSGQCSETAALRRSGSSQTAFLVESGVVPDTAHTLPPAVLARTTETVKENDHA
jgi:hypothetical protein